MQPLSAHLSWRRLRTYCERALGRFDAAGESLLVGAPAVSAWSPAEHLFHVALSNELGLRNLRALAAGTNRRIKEYEDLSELGQGVLRSGRYPRGQAEAPRMVRPPARIELSILRELLESNLRDLLPLEEALDAFQTEERCIPHQELGDLHPRAWLRFLHAHSIHHALIVRDIERARAATDSALA